MYGTRLITLFSSVLVAQARNYGTNYNCCLQSQEVLKYINDLSNMANTLSNQADSLKRSVASMPSTLSQCNRRVNPTLPPSQIYATRALTPAPRYDPRYDRRYVADRNLFSSSGIVKASCKEWFEYNRYNNNGEVFVIDPFRVGRPVRVRCIFTNNQILTEIEPKPVRPRDQVFEGDQRCYSKSESIPGEQDYCEERVIQYTLSREDIYRVAHISGTCSQKVMWGCHGHNILYVVTALGAWNVYGVTLTSDDPYYKQGWCDCGLNRNCTSNLSCECSAEKDQWATDYITIPAGENNANLPIKIIAVGDLDGRRERAQIMVEKIICSTPMDDAEEIVELVNGEEQTTTTVESTPPTTPAVPPDTVTQN